MKLKLAAAFLAASFSLSHAADPLPLFPGAGVESAQSHSARISAAHEVAMVGMAGIEPFAVEAGEEPLMLPGPLPLPVPLLAAMPQHADVMVTGSVDPSTGAEHSWQGFHAGISAGLAGFSSDTTNSMYGDFSLSGEGATFGILAGYNWQDRGWVVGMEADFDLTTLAGDAGTGGGITSFDERYHLREEWRASLRARLGRPVGAGLAYVTAGIAFAELAQYYTEPGWAPTEDASEILTGWTIGAGWEAPVLRNWVLRAEYRYTDLAPTTFQCGICGPTDNDFRSHSLRAALVFRF